MEASVGAAVRRATAALRRASAADLVVAQPRWTATLATRALAGVRFEVATRRQAVALTFDDGPHGVVTPALLDVLAAHDATATFFIVGDHVAGNETVVRRIVDDGHELGAHGMNATADVTVTRAAFERELLACVDTLQPWGPVRYFRPASGWIRPDQLAVARRHGLTCALGSITLARDPITAPRRAARLLDRRVRSGAILVLHEGASERANVVECVDMLLSMMRDRGYAALALRELDS
jgi:peptidoglycan/xylan/chitin deacetylase (PgdA/CDA1 family)